MDLLGLFATYLIASSAALLFMSLVFLVGLRLNRYDLIDVAWGPVFIVIAAVSLGVNAPAPTPSLVAAILVLIWGVRLAYHIGMRWIKSTREDRRYTELRSKWPRRYIGLQIFVKMFLTQGLLASFVMLPVIIMASGRDAAISTVAAVGLVIWCSGFIIESVADRQLRVFMQRATKSGQLMTTGLWRYSRHPNYFGEMLQWWGIGIIGLYQITGVFGLIGPLLITILIVFISGIPPAERGLKSKAGWSVYQARTSALIPLPPRKLR